MDKNFLETDSKRGGMFSTMVKKISDIETWIRKHNSIKHQGLPSSGWTEVSDTWSQATSSSINVPSDATTYLQKGTKLRFKQGGAYKYMPIYNLSAVLLACLPTPDFSVTAAPITDIAYSNIEKPYGWPDFFNFVPTITKLPSYTACKVKLYGNSCHFEFSADNKTLTAGAATFITVSLPVTPLTLPFSPALINNGAGWLITAMQTDGTPQIDISKTGALGTWAGGEAGVYIRFAVDFLYS
jgi:hypothetical protein